MSGAGAGKRQVNLALPSGLATWLRVEAASTRESMSAIVERALWAERDRRLVKSATRVSV